MSTVAVSGRSDENAAAHPSPARYRPGRMALRDLGYKSYEGERLDASRNTAVLLRHGFRRAWGSWFVKIAAFTCWVPPLVGLGLLGIQLWIAKQMLAGGAASAARAPNIQVPFWVRGIFDWQFWLFVTMISVGAGASMIAEDRTFRAFQFYFAKPVTPVQYLAGRVWAISVWIFWVTFLPAVLLVLLAMALAPPGLHMERAGLFLPTALYSLVMAVVMASGAVGMSALSKSRALTMTAWAMLLLIPHVLASLVEAIGKWPWLSLASIPKLLGVIGDALFKIQTESDVRWYHATPILIALVAGSLYLAFDRVRRAEVIA